MTPERLYLAAVLVLAAALRLTGIGSEGLWSDECTTAVWAARPPATLVAIARADNHPPLYFLITAGASALLGRSEMAWRLPSALAAVAACLLTWSIGRCLLSPAAGLFAGWLLALSPMHVHYGREARSYALLTLLVLAAFRLAVALQRRPSLPAALALAAAALGALYTHNLAGFALVSVAPALLRPWPGRAVIRAAAAALLITLLGYAPWLPSLRSQAGAVGTSFGWAGEVFAAEFPAQVIRSLAAYAPSAPAPVRNWVATLPASAWLGLSASLALAGLGIAAARGTEKAENLQALALATLLPLILLFATSLVLSPIYVVGRSDAPLQPFFLLLVASSIDATRKHLRPLLVAAAAALAAAPLAAARNSDQRSFEREMVAAVREVVGRGEPLVSTSLHACLEHYGGFQPGLDLLAFPAERLTHPDWVDWRRHDDAALAADAAAVATAAAAAASGNGRICALTDPSGQPLLAALATRHRLVSRGQREGVPLTLSCYAAGH